MPLQIETTLIESDPLSAAAGRRIWLKLDALQPPAPSRFAASVQQQGAELIVHGAAWHEANALAQSMLGDDDAFLHPFDDPLLWQGHASLIDEVASAGVKPDAVVVSVGGGGLFCGVIEGLRRNGWQDIPVVTAETVGADALARSLAADERIALDAITSIATSLGARQVCEQAFALARQHPVRPVVVSDQAALQACERFLDDHRILVEPACGASLALAYDRTGALEDFGNVLVVVCGGVTASIDLIGQWRTALAAT